jgi:drug/metabolite transporter (DMT)-like permease
MSNDSIKYPSGDPQNLPAVAIRYLSYLNPLTIHKKSKKAKAVFALCLVCFFWGTTWLASRKGVQYMPALQLAGIRQFIGGSFYVVYFLAKGTRLPAGREWIPIIVLSCLNFMLSNGLSTWGVKYISAGLGSIIGAIFPLWLVVIGLFSTPMPLKKKAAMGLLLGFAGICVIFFEHLHDFIDPRFTLGILLSIASTWSWAFGTIYTKKHAEYFNPYFGLGLQMVISGITLFTVSNLTGNAIPLATIPWQSWAAIAYLAVFGSVISFIAYLYALQNLPTEQASLYAYINPVVAVFFGWLLLNEPLSVYMAAGVLITLVGVYLVNRNVIRS